MSRLDLRMLGLWVLVFLGAESVGFALAFGTGRGLYSALGEPDNLATEILIAIVAGLIEGAALALGQWTVLRRRLPGLSLPEYALHTALAGALAWALGFGLGGSGVEIQRVGLMMGASGLFLGALIGAAQAKVLATVEGPVAPWIVANGLGWGAGLFALSAAMTHDFQGPLAFLAAAFGGLVMALAPAILTGAVVAGLDDPAAGQAGGSAGPDSTDSGGGSLA